MQLIRVVTHPDKYMGPNVLQQPVYGITERDIDNALRYGATTRLLVTHA